MKCRNAYRMPVDKQLVLFYSIIGPPAHLGKLKHSIDFALAEGTPVYAARSGIVTWVKNDSNKGGLQKRYWFDGNRIVIRHENGEYTAYEHLKYKSALVKARQKVRAGQLIALSGNTGYSLSPHLHFEVFNQPDEEESEGTTLEVFFPELRQLKRKRVR